MGQAGRANSRGGETMTAGEGSGALRRSIAGRLLFWFLVIALIPCAILTAITARIAATALQKAVRDNLVQIAAGKANELEAYAAERVRDGAAFARGPTFTAAVRDLTATAASGGDLRQAGGSSRDYFLYVAKAFDYALLARRVDPLRLVRDQRLPRVFGTRQRLRPGPHAAAVGSLRVPTVRQVG